MAASYVQVRTKRRLRCPDQPGPRHDPNPNPNPNLIPNPNPTLWGALGLLSRSAGAVVSLRAILKTLHVRAVIRVVIIDRSARCCSHINSNNQVRGHIYPADLVSRRFRESIVRLSLGKLQVLVNRLQVIKRTNTQPIPNHTKYRPKCALMASLG